MKRDYFTSAVILASGRGERFGKHELPKQMWPLLGKPVCVHTLEAFSQASLVDEMILVVPEGDLNNYKKILGKYSFEKELKIVSGGETRQASSVKGVEACSSKAKFVSIHDSVRCLITPQTVDKVILKAHETGAAIAAAPATDTIKRSKDGKLISETIPRDQIWLAQTPQVFEIDLYRGCLYQVMKKEIEVTDDASVVEQFGVKVHLVNAGASNLKITYYSDVELAKTILQNRGDPLG